MKYNYHSGGTTIAIGIQLESHDRRRVTPKQFPHLYVAHYVQHTLVCVSQKLVTMVTACDLWDVRAETEEIVHPRAYHDI